MEVESHEEALVEVMVFCKLRPATLEVHLTGPVVPDLHFIGSSSPRVFTKNRFPQFSPVHELGELQRHPLNLTALSTGDAEEGVHSGQRRRSIMRRSARTWRSRGNLGLILASHRAAGAPFRWSRRLGYHSWDRRLVLTATGAAVTFFLHRVTNVQTQSTCISHGDKCWEGKTLDAMRKRKMVRRKKRLMNELGFFTLAKHALFIRTH
jgi:hypothetical protein